MSYQGVFFDFDYTLGDSTEAIAEGYRRGFAAMGLPQPTVEQVRATVGMRLEDGYTFLTGDAGAGRQAEFHRLFAGSVGVNAQGEDRKLMIEGTRLLPGAVELLSALRAAGVRPSCPPSRGIPSGRFLSTRDSWTCWIWSSAGTRWPGPSPTRKGLGWRWAGWG